MIELHIPGKPVPWAPAHNPREGGRIVPARPAAQAARILLAWQGLGVERIDKPAGVAIMAVFTVSRPLGHYGTGRNARLLKPWATALEPTGRPDLSNLCKLIEDALTEHAWHDDDQITRWADARKVYINAWENPGTHIAYWRSRPSRAPEPGQLALTNGGDDRAALGSGAVRAAGVR